SRDTFNSTPSFQRKTMCNCGLDPASRRLLIRGVSQILRQFVIAKERSTHFPGDSRQGLAIPRAIFVGVVVASWWLMPEFPQVLCAAAEPASFEPTAGPVPMVRQAQAEAATLKQE